MYRIDDATASTTLPTPETAGTEGYFTEGNPATATPATKVRGSWLNMIQEELRALVVYGGLTPSKTVYTQVRDAILAKFAKINGDNTQVFSVATATQSQHAMQLGQAVGRLLNVQVFGTSGTYTPTAGMTKVIAEVQGAGGGTGGAPTTSTGGYSGSPGASSGAYAMVLLTAAQIGSSVAVTVGAPGTAGASGSSTGGTGGTTSVGSLVSCPGGPGSSSYGPTASTVTIANAPGSAASPTISAGQSIMSSQGSLGAGAIGTTSGGVLTAQGGISSIDKSATGAGHGAQGTALGASSSAIAGVAGAAGKIIFWEYA